MTILSRIRKWFQLVTNRKIVVTCSPDQALLNAMQGLLTLPTHEEFDKLLVRESLRRCGGNYKSAALLIGRSESHMRRSGR